MKPLVSIITPSYNQGNWLEDNIRSVLNQTYDNVEHIVMDGGSTDNTIGILDRYGGVVKWKSESDRGQSHALNKGFAESSGDIIGWINSDDAYVDQRAIEQVVKAFQANPDVGVVYGHGLMVSQSNSFQQFMWSPEFDNDILRKRTFFVQPSVFIRRSVIQPPFVDESLHFIMDRDLWLRLAAVTKFLRVPLVIGLDRNQPERKSAMAKMKGESSAYRIEKDIPELSRSERITMKFQNIRYRLMGMSWVLGIENRIQPSISVQYRSVWHRVLHQVVLPRHKMNPD